MAPRPCLAIDFPGHGDSDRFERYHFDLERDGVLGLLGLIGQPAILVGHSMGGLAACAAAAAQPELVVGVFLEDVTPLFLDNPERRSFPLLPGVFRIPRLVATMRAEGRSTAWLTEQIGTFRHDEYRSVSEALPAVAVADWAEQATTIDPERVGPKLSTDPSEMPPQEQLRRYRGPLHVAHGDPGSGTMVPTAEIDAVRTLRPDLTTTSRYPGGGHLLHGQFPDRFARDLRAFVERVDPSS